MDKERIAETLRELRKTKGVSAAEVGKACGIGASAILNYEAGTRIPEDEIKIRLAKYYKKTVQSIFFK